MILSMKSQSLHKRLLDYFSNDKFDITEDVSKVLYDLILQNVDCDYDKLSLALGQLLAPQLY